MIIDVFFLLRLGWKKIVSFYEVQDNFLNRLQGCLTLLSPYFNPIYSGFVYLTFWTLSFLCVCRCFWFIVSDYWVHYSRWVTFENGTTPAIYHISFKNGSDEMDESLLYTFYWEYIGPPVLRIAFRNNLRVIVSRDLFYRWFFWISRVSTTWNHTAARVR